MFSGIQELILLIILLILLLWIPRLFINENKLSFKKKLYNFKMISRIFIVTSLFWLLGSALYIKPWEIENYILKGIFPVALFWAILWIKSGLKNK